MEQLNNIFHRFAGKIEVKSLRLPDLDFSSPFLKLLLIVVSIIVISFMIDFLLSRSVFGGRYRIFVAPGVILHELSHALFCMVTGAKIKKIALFEKEGGSVEHEPSKLPVFGQILISFAPFVFGAAVIYFLSKMIGMEKIDFQSMKMSYGSFFDTILLNAKHLEWKSWQTWIILYLVLSIAVTMTPSKKDLENVLLSVIFLILIYLAIYQFTSFRIPANLVPEGLIILLITTVFLLIMSLIFSIVIYVLSKIFKH
jgi:hypothetical protein